MIKNFLPDARRILMKVDFHRAPENKTTQI